MLPERSNFQLPPTWTRATYAVGPGGAIACCSHLPSVAQRWAAHPPAPPTPRRPRAAGGRPPFPPRSRGRANGAGRRRDLRVSRPGFPVDDTGIEPVTSSVSRKRSPTELIVRGDGRGGDG